MSLNVDQTAMMEEMEKADSSASSEGASDLAPDSEAKEASSPLVDLDQTSKFKFEGKEWTRDELKAHLLRQEDYTRKTQELARERETYQQHKDYIAEKKFHDNLKFDLEAIRENPRLVSEFLKIYPEKFHYLAEQITGQKLTQNNPTEAQTTGSKSPYAQVDPQVMQEFQQIKNYVFETQVKANEAQLEAYDQKFQAQFKMADPEAVYAKAEAIYAQQRNQDPNFKLTEQMWEKIWKADHEKNQKRYEAVYKEQVNKQKKASQRGQDIAGGGGVAGASPKQYKNIREATQAALADLDS